MATIRPLLALAVASSGHRRIGFFRGKAAQSFKIAHYAASSFFRSGAPGNQSHSRRSTPRTRTLTTLQIQPQFHARSPPFAYPAPAAPAAGCPVLHIRYPDGTLPAYASAHGARHNDAHKTASLFNQAARTLSSLQQQTPHQKRHAQEKARRRSAVSCRACGRTFTRPARDPQQDLSPSGNPGSVHAVRSRQHARSDRGKNLFPLRPPGRALDNLALAFRTSRAHHLSPSPRSRPAIVHPTQIIRTHKLYHRQVYEFAYHRAKLAFLRDGTLDNKRASGTNSTARFSSLADFLESVPHACPHDLFLREDGGRGSQLASDFLAMESWWSSTSRTRRPTQRRS